MKFNSVSNQNELKVEWVFCQRIRFKCQSGLCVLFWATIIQKIFLGILRRVYIYIYSIFTIPYLIPLEEVSIILDFIDGGEKTMDTLELKQCIGYTASRQKFCWVKEPYLDFGYWSHGAYRTLELCENRGQ